MLVIGRLLTGLLLFFPFFVSATGARAPDVGTLLQQIPSQQPKAAPVSKLPGLMIEGADGKSATLPHSIPIFIRNIRITRNTVFDNATLMALVKHAEGRSLTLPELGELADLITSYYQSKGYPITRAMIPAQTITGGLVRIEVLEAKIGEIKLENSSRVRDALLQSTLTPLKNRGHVEQTSIDHVLLLLSDVPGITVKATLKPGQGTGTSDLVVATPPLPALSGDFVTDNYGNRFTGQVRATGMLTYNNLLHQGDTVNFSGLNSGSGLTYWRLAYEATVNGLGQRVGASTSNLEYFLGGPVSSANAYGGAQVQSLWTRQPLVRSVKRNVYGQIQYDQLQTGDPSSSGNQTLRSLQNWTASLTGDAREAFFANGISSWNASLTHGHVAFNDATDATNDPAKTQGLFSKLNLNLAHLQGIGPKDSLYLSYVGQWANANLDSSQKLSVGGANSVRAYRMGVISGDVGHVISAEWRHELGQALKSQWRALAFFDTAQVTVNKNPWVTGTNSATLRGAGVGLSWAGPDKWSGRATLAYPLGSIPALVDTTASPIGWVEIRTGF
ncbi:MAG: ShlB/FhaC/HecB family hemolysin secretion/activation protein [Polaromonas sp.]|nr:ShlB/FhaC/HecB family hemolysin secretion/activation protein [Polaromonas sp.]